MFNSIHGLLRYSCFASHCLTKNLKKELPMRSRGLTIAVLTLILLTSSGTQMPGQASAATSSHSDQIRIDTKALVTPFPHFWEQIFGSGRAVLAMRDSYRSDLRTVKQATGFDAIRFHAIFHDEVGLFNLDSNGRPVYNFSYINQIYDGLLANGVRPFVELSFMPLKLASDPAALHAFWYRPNISPPKD